MVDCVRSVDCCVFLIDFAHCRREGFDCRTSALREKQLHVCHMLRSDLLSSILVVLTHNLYEVSNTIHPPPKYKNAMGTQFSELVTQSVS